MTSYCNKLRILKLKIKWWLATKFSQFISLWWLSCYIQCVVAKLLKICGGQDILESSISNVKRVIEVNNTLRDHRNDI